MCLRPPVWWCRGQDLNRGPSFRACTPSLPRSLLVSQGEMWAASSLCTCRLLPPCILLCGCRSTASAALLKSRRSGCRGLAESGAGSGPPQRLTADSATLGPREPGLSPSFWRRSAGSWDYLWGWSAPLPRELPPAWSLFPPHQAWPSGPLGLVTGICGCTEDPVRWQVLSQRCSGLRQDSFQPLSDVPRRLGPCSSAQSDNRAFPQRPREPLGPQVAEAQGG